MVAERDNFLSRLNQKVATLATMMNDTPEAKHLSDPPWIYSKSCVVLDFALKKLYSVSFDLYLEPTGWQLQLFGRNKKSEVYLTKLMNHPALRTRTTKAQRVDNRHIVQRWPLAADLGDIRDALCSWIRSLIAAAKSSPA